jgi:SAM-dependent methyltransferase
MTQSKKEKWNNCYNNADIATATPANILQQNSHLLPLSGQALDLACGRAGNAQLLAKQGLFVDAFDLSDTVIDALTRFAHNAINPQVWNSETNPLATEYYDVIVVSYFLQRNIFPDIINALKTGGLLFYQTWSQQCINASGPSNPAFRLQHGELLSLCADLRIVYYQEEGELGDTQQGNRNEACIIAEKQ